MTGKPANDPDPARTYNRALDMLTRASRSARDLRRRLLLKGEPKADVDVTVERLTASGLLNDDAYARAFVRSKVASQGFSRRRLQQELAKRGVAREIADSAIEEVLREENVDETAAIQRLAQKKLRALQSLDMPTRRRRLSAYLARRGYAVQEIRRITQRLLSAQ